MLVKGLRVAVAALLLGSAITAVVRSGGNDTAALAVGGIAPKPMILPTTSTTETTTTTTTSLPPPPPPTAAPTTAAARPKATIAPRRRPAPAPRPAAAPGAITRVPLPTGSLAEYRGLGAWIDVFDWAAAYTNGNPSVGTADIDRMADFGVQTLYVQAARHDSPNTVQEPERLIPLIDRAHQRGMRVVAWYLPTLENLAADLDRLVAIAALNVESVAVDIESTKVADVNERNRRLVDLSAQLRRALPGRSIGAIVLPAVVLEVINQNYWPNFPYRELIPYYDVWMPMSYWTNRTQASGYRDAWRYTAENIDRLRNNLGLPNAPVHAIGGIGDKTTPLDADGYLRASNERGALGGSLYDYRTTRDDVWPVMQRFRG